MNIVNAYKKFNNQLIIIISGLSGCNKNNIAKTLATTFDIEFVRQDNFINKNFKNMKKEQNFKNNKEFEINDIYTNDYINWDAFNKHINEVSKNGVVISGITFPTDLIKFKPDFHIHLKMTKEKCMDTRFKYLKDNKNDLKDQYQDFVTGKDNIIMNKYLYPYYLSNLNNMHINKFLKINDKTDDEIWDEIWDIIISFIKRRINSN